MNGSIRQRSKGTWQLRYDAPPDGTGKRRYVSETFKGNKKDAEQALRDRLTAIDNGNHVERDKETVFEFMTRWMGTYAVTNTTLKTQQGYRAVIRRYIGPALGNTRLQNLAARQIQSLYSEMTESGLGATSVVSVHHVLKEALGHAVKWGAITRNVADATSPPRIERKTMEMWDISDIHRFLDAAANDRFNAVYHLAILTGLRRSELFGLKWDAVDLAGCTLRVVRTLQRITGYGLVEGQPKTKRSRRVISLAPVAVELLHGVRGAQMEHQIEYGDLWQNTGYVFTQLNGQPVDPDMVSKKFPKLVKAQGLPHLTFHGLRHANATLALIARVKPKVLSERLGHSSIAVTMDIYAHLIPGMEEEAALAVEQLLERPGTV